MELNRFLPLLIGLLLGAWTLVAAWAVLAARARDQRTESQLRSARRLARMNANLSQILGVELLCAAEGIEHRAPLKTSASLQTVMAALRGVVPSLEKDRYMAPDLETAAGLIRSRKLVSAISAGHMITLGDAHAAG